MVIAKDNKYFKKRLIFFSSLIILFCKTVNPKTISKETPIITRHTTKTNIILQALFLDEYLKFSQNKSSGSGGSSTSTPFILLNFIFSPLVKQQ